MQTNFVFVRKALHYEKRFTQSLAMHIMSGFFILLYGMQYLFTQPIAWMELIAINTVAIAVLIIPIFKKNYLKQIEYIRIFRLLQFGFLFMGAMHYLQNKNNTLTILFICISLFILLLLWLELKIFRTQYIVFSDEYILIEQDTKTNTIAWNKIKNCLIKQNMVTLVYTDENIKQYEISTDTNKDLIEACNSWLSQKLN